MEAPKIQLAFQGGGAKFLAMLPVAHAFCDLEKKEKIQISAAAGTSAGSICAALVASNCNFAQLRTYIKTHGREHLTKLIPPEAVGLGEAFQNARVDFVALYKFFRLRKKIYSIFKYGDPVLDESEFGIFIDKVLDFCTLGNRYIERLPKKLSISVTDLAGSHGLTINSGSIKKSPPGFVCFTNAIPIFHVFID